jgi:hypothetical protein
MEYTIVSGSEMNVSRIAQATLGPDFMSPPRLVNLPIVLCL